jgi:hypothetical protein
MKKGLTSLEEYKHLVIGFIQDRPIYRENRTYSKHSITDGTSQCNDIHVEEIKHY